MAAKDPKRGLEYNMKDLWIESMLLLPAGADTTSTTMSAAFYLLHNPDALSRATAELKDCKILQACIDETMRLVPAVPLASPRHVEAGGLTVGGDYLPEGTIVGTSLYTMQRHPAYFDRSDSFCPERWLSDPGTGVTKEMVNRSLHAFSPFGIGPWTCVGWKLGWMELNLTLARTLFLYDLRLAQEPPAVPAHRPGQSVNTT
ncbi:Cytochrome p450 [Aspergillus sp. HF37]|nr:Cytochrome p450 [Aspergillus sp. HF37]